ncbi:MAG: mechanosensitive ion channel domain-containing protein [bacterium]
MTETIKGDSWFMWGLQQDWFSWGIALLLLFPLAIVLLGEFQDYLELRGSAFSKVIKHLKHQVLPQLVLLLLLTRVFDYDNTSTLVRIVETLLYVFLIHVSLAFVDILLFSDRHTTDWRAKVPKLVLDISRAFLVLIGTAIVLSNVWGFELGRLLTALGVGSVVLGLALQDTLGSLFSGFALLSSRQFRVGDWLAVGDQEGKIITMNWRTVTLLTRDQDIIIVPNSELAKSSFLNYSHPYPLHMERINFDFSFDDAPYKVKKALLEAARETPGILADPPPNVALISYDEFSIRHEMQYFIEHFTDQPAIKNDFMSRIWYLAKRHGITFPTRAHEVYHYHPEKTKPVSSEELAMPMLEKILFLRNKEIIRREMARNARILEYGTGETIVHQGEASDTLFIIEQGSVVEKYRDTHGHSHNTSQLQEGDFFGMTSMVRNEPSEVTVQASEDSVVIAIDQDTTHQLLERHPKFALEMEQLVARRNREIRTIKEKMLKLDADPTDVITNHEEKDKVVQLKRFLQRS